MRGGDQGQCGWRVVHVGQEVVSRLYCSERSVRQADKLKIEALSMLHCQKYAGRLPLCFCV